MSKEMKFFIYLIENYAYYNTADKVLKTLTELNILEKIFNNYEFYHIERMENTYKDIDELIKGSTK